MNMLLGIAWVALAGIGDIDRLTLWYEQPAERWEEALPVGNGRLGAMVFGGIEYEQIQMNEDSIWAGSPIQRDRIGAHEHLDRARTLFFEGRIKEGQELMQREFMTERLVRSYQTLGTLDMSFGGIRDASDYRRSLDLKTGITTTRFKDGDATHTRTVFASHANDVIVVHLECDQPGRIEMALTVEREGEFRPLYMPRGIVMAGTAQQENGEHPGVDFISMIGIRHVGGTLESTDNGTWIEGADSVTLLVAARTDHRTGGNEVSICSDDVKRVTRIPIEILLKDHMRKFSQQFDRVMLELGNEPTKAIPTDERLRMVREGGVDLDLEALYFQYGRYLLMSSSQPGSMPANLQGLWNPYISAPWNSDYHININCQMNYWPAESCNLSECHEPFFDLIDGIRVRGRETARELYDCPGWVAHHTTDAWYFTSPIGRTVWGLWPTGGAWCTRHLWEHYQYGLDREFLEQRAWPVMKESAEFFLEYLVEDPATGRLVSGPSSSPENTFRTEDGDVVDTSMGPSMDQEIIFDLFTNVLDAAAVLGVDDEFVRRVSDARKRLAMPGVGEDGRLMEWARPYEENEPGHRHMSHLYGLHPSNLFTLDRTPAYVAAARKSLEHRLEHGGGHTGWSRAWIINFWARMHEGDLAHQNLLELLRRSTLPNLFDDHPPFQIDGNFGATAGMAEMLLQAHDGVIDLLPALPTAWSDGRVRGLRAKGGVTVDIDWADGRISEAVLRPIADGNFLVRSGEHERRVRLRAGEPARLEFN